MRTASVAILAALWCCSACSKPAFPLVGNAQYDVVAADGAVRVVREGIVIVALPTPVAPSLEMHTTKTDAKGDFRFESLSSGTWNVTAHLPAPASTAVSPSTGTVVFTARYKEAQPPPAAGIKGLVHDVRIETACFMCPAFTEVPVLVPGRIVELLQDHRVIASTESAIDGTFSFVAGPGQYEVGLPASPRVKVDLSAEALVDVRIAVSGRSSIASDSRVTPPRR